MFVFSQVDFDQVLHKTHSFILDADSSLDRFSILSFLFPLAYFTPSYHENEIYVSIGTLPLECILFICSINSFSFVLPESCAPLHQREAFNTLKLNQLTCHT